MWEGVEKVCDGAFHIILFIYPSGLFGSVLQSQDQEDYYSYITFLWRPHGIYYF